MSKTFIYLLLIGLFISCSRKPYGEFNDKGIVVPINVNNNKEISFSRLFDSVSYIPLETTDEALVGIVEHMRIFGNNLCLLCDKNVLIFDTRTGNVITQISKFGNGPGEYQSLYDILINEDNLIQLLDMNSRKIRTYNFKGNFISEISLPSMSFAFSKKGDKYWLYNNNLQQEDITSQVICYEPATSKIREEIFPMNQKLSNYFFVLEGNNFAQTDDGLLFFANPRNQIFLIKENAVPEAVYTLDFGKHSLPGNFMEEEFSDIMDFSQWADSREYIYFVNNFTTDTRNLQISFWLGEQIYWTFFSKPSLRSETAQIIKDDINDYKPIKLKNTNSDAIISDGYFYFLLSPEQYLKAYIEKKQVLQDLTEQSNPVMVKCKLKKDIIL